MEHRESSRVALITGASSGIGRAVARTLAGLGYTVVLCARREARLQALADELGSERAWPIACDLRDETRISKMFAALRERFGGVDVLINNAGLGREASLLEGATEHWREMLEVNVLALSICTREAVRDMRARGDDGHVVHVSSMAAHRVPKESGVYSATKFAVRSLTEGLRRELRAIDSGVRVTSISPGFVETEFAQVHAHGDPDAAARTYGASPCLQPEDIADAVRYVVTAPSHVQVHDVLLRPTRQPD